MVPFFFEEPDIGLDQLQTESPQSGEPAEPIQTKKVNEELTDKCKIIVLDNYINGIENEFELDGNIQCIKHDIINKIEINENIDYILHAAGIASPLFYSKYKLETMKTTIDGTQHVLDMAIKNNCESVLFFSTSEIYGSPSD